MYVADVEVMYYSFLIFHHDAEFLIRAWTQTDSNTAEPYSHFRPIFNNGREDFASDVSHKTPSSCETDLMSQLR
jgi:hypothetical protein